ncbi:hydroxymethylglutaryl-CoA synthase [Coemansia reversa NRRL 1564]|uniref:Hydroxymethylglutaryl-CoA synthase n=1 Tax=Coemansia reversa (strain ATCC 12441 / NRRL 1564) TaxID=763665 RepID=A0A2G5BBX4_COERN|nr:hydroxymethylglutaryl-CoA synthase [Coemansia reversa NRRL 1564]|eukprot:PIA16518.1 hydroxymethylglutaryl-CoA synthase [Coemansia reversa NRRL 1564]
MSTPRAENVGILAIDVYFPSRYVDQTELEQHDGVSAGKYTIGLGQSKMAFCDDREDISSVSMTAVQGFMEKYNISYSDIGRLEVGTETIIDKSKSTKTVLMKLFEESGNFNVEGIDTTNACYGGTSALFNACQWVDSAAWDGRLALVVAGDIAVYGKGAARPSGGVGTACILVGPNAPLALEFPLRGTFMEHIYDFYKPNMSSEFPTVDGPLSVTSYVRAVDHAYSAYLDKLEKVAGIANPSLADLDYVVFHSPYTKQVVKGFARMVYNDFLRNPEAKAFAEVQQFKDILREESYGNKVLEKAFINVSKSEFASKTESSLLAARNIGNMYTGSVFFGLASLISQTPFEKLNGKRIALFSYGSGCAASTYSFRVRGDTSNIARTIDLAARLDKRIKVAPADFEKVMELREKTHNAQEYEPTGNINELQPGTYYLQKIDSKWRRAYGRIPLN